MYLTHCKATRLDVECGSIYFRGLRVRGESLAGFCSYDSTVHFNPNDLELFRAASRHQ